ncbi:MAG: hypothetical protein J6P21_03610 [Clostridia bacterium]|nr:hypothetical protein [Clostridia bacterium]
MEVIHSILGGLTDFGIGKGSIGRLIKNHVNKNNQPGGPEHEQEPEKIGNGQDNVPKKSYLNQPKINMKHNNQQNIQQHGQQISNKQINIRQHNQQLINNAFNNITNADGNTENYSKEFKLFAQNKELEVAKKLFDEAKRYFLNPVQEHFSNYLCCFWDMSKVVRYSTIAYELPYDENSEKFKIGRETLMKEMHEGRYVILDEKVKKELKLDDDQNCYINFIAGCLTGKNKLDSFNVKREIGLVGKILYKFEFVSNNNKIVFCWYSNTMLDIKFNNFSLIYLKEI